MGFSVLFNYVVVLDRVFDNWMWLENSFTVLWNSGASLGFYCMTCNKTNPPTYAVLFRKTHNYQILELVSNGCQAFGRGQTWPGPAGMGSVLCLLVCSYFL